MDSTMIQVPPEAIAYQEQLLGLLGADDPAEVQASHAARTLRSLVREAGADVRTRPEPREWSVLECIGHIVDAELVSSGRYRFILAHDRPDLPGYDQDAWADALHHNDEDPDELLAPFDALRSANLGPVATLVGRGPGAGRDAPRTRPRELRPHVPHDRGPRPVPSEAGARDPRDAPSHGRPPLMCRSIKTLRQSDVPATDDEIRAAALQYVRKISGFRHPTKRHEAAFEAAVDEVSWPRSGCSKR